MTPTSMQPRRCSKSRAAAAQTFDTDIDDLLDVSRITHNKIELRKNQTELVSILKGAAELSRRHLQGRGQTLDFPIPEEPIYLEADETRLEQAFGNLSGESLPWDVLDHPQHSTEPEVRQTEALNDLNLRIYRFKTTCVDQHELEGQRWLVRGLVDSEFALKRHEASDAMSLVYGLSPSAAAKSMAELRSKSDDHCSVLLNC